MRGASSTGRCNTIKAVDPTILSLEDRSVRVYSSRPKQDGVAFESMLANDFGFLKLLQVDFEQMLRRPIETAPFVRRQSLQSQDAICRFVLISAIQLDLRRIAFHRHCCSEGP